MNKKLVIVPLVLCLAAFVFALAIRCLDRSGVMCVGTFEGNIKSYTFSQFANEIYGELYVN